MCVITGRDKNTYYHELFLRGKRSLSHNIQRIKFKGTGARKPSSPKTEPDFYAMPYLPDTEVVQHGPREQQGVLDSNLLPWVAFLQNAALLNRNCFGGRIAVAEGIPSIPVCASATRAFAQSLMQPSASSPSSASILALNMAAQRARPPPDPLSEAMFHMHFGLPPPMDAMLLEHSRLVRAVGTQSLDSAYRAASVTNNLESFQEYVRRSEQDQLLAALILGGKMHR
jgi:hypothetical protein